MKNITLQGGVISSFPGVDLTDDVITMVESKPVQNSISICGEAFPSYYNERNSNYELLTLYSGADVGEYNIKVEYKDKVIEFKETWKSGGSIEREDYDYNISPASTFVFNVLDRDDTKKSIFKELGILDIRDITEEIRFSVYLRIDKKSIGGQEYLRNVYWTSYFGIKKVDESFYLYLYSLTTSNDGLYVRRYRSGPHEDEEVISNSRTTGELVIDDRFTDVDLISLEINPVSSGGFIGVPR